MFGNNPVAKNEIKLDGSVLQVVGGKPWYTIQGEGPFAGDPAVFLRLHGCPLQCFFCDTYFSDPADPWLTITEITNMIEAAAPAHCTLLVITGGEPVRQNLEPLIKVMNGDGWTVQIETSGILWQECLMDTVIICSPKTPKIHPKIALHASGFKYVIRHGETDPDDGLPVTNTQDEDGAKVRLARPPVGTQTAVYLSPMDEGENIFGGTANAANRAEVARVALQFGYRAGLQLHKFMGVD